jgi:hypothetical protein
MPHQKLAAVVLSLSTLVAGQDFASAQNAVQQPTPEATAAASQLPNAPSAAGNPEDLPLESQPHSPVTVARTPKHTLTDLTHIAISPIYLRGRDLEWILPLTAATAAAFATDTHTMQHVVSRDPSFNAISANVSDGLRDGLIALPVGLFGMGQFRHNEHMRESGILAGEAMVDAVVVDEFSKLVTYRERPNVDQGRGDFYIIKSGGVNSSFVSGHSMIAWSSAAALAGESHSKLTDFLLYFAATGVSVSRVTAQEHFPTDVLLGSAGGWLIGHYVYRAHHHADVRPSP